MNKSRFIGKPIKHIQLLSSEINTPLGTMRIVGNTDGICILDFNDRNIIDAEINHLEKYYNSTVSECTNKHIEELKSQLAEYFNGTRKQFEIPNNRLSCIKYFYFN